MSGRHAWHSVSLVMVAWLLLRTADARNNSCILHPDITAPIASLLCEVEARGLLRGRVVFPSDTAFCLVGEGQCDQPLHVPTADEVLKVTDLPVADNTVYQRLSLVAESFIPSKWWREAFNDSSLLLTPKVSPHRLLLLSRQVRIKRLRNLANCLARISVIRKDFSEKSDVGVPRDECRARKVQAVQHFKEQWTVDGGRLGGIFSAKGSLSFDISNAVLYESARDALSYFIDYGGNAWIGCLRLSKSRYCKGALAAASLLEAISTLAEIATQDMTLAKLGSKIAEGFLLASIGRHLIHGSHERPQTPVTPWGVKLVDFVALQSVFFRVYLDSFGKKYSEQLDRYIPLAFPPDLSLPSPSPWKSYASQIEPVYSTLRNWMFTEANNPIDFGPYHPLVAIPSAREAIGRSNGRRVLIDVGASGFFASPKYLLDSYAIYLPFTEVIMIEPVPRFKATIPDSYLSSYNITVHPIYAEVGTGSDTDIIKLIPSLVHESDFVVLKFDVDPNRNAVGPTMEWGFIFALVQNLEVLRLVDELYVELHFHFPMMQWRHYHSNWEALDLLRFLRSHGLVVHSWP